MTLQRLEQRRFAGTGSFDPHARGSCEIAEKHRFDMGGWRFLPAIEGFSAWLRDQQLWAVREAGGWVTGAVRAARVVIDSQQIIGGRMPSATAPIGSGIIDAEARTAIIELSARLVAHSLIDE